MYHGGDMIMRVRRSKLNGAYTCTTLRQKPFGKYQFHRKKRDHMQYILGGANITLETQTANCYCPFFLLWLFHPVIPRSNDHVCRIFPPKALVIECFSLTYKAIVWQAFPCKTFLCSKSDFRIFFSEIT